MSHIERVSQAVERLELADAIHDRTVWRAHGNEERIRRANFHHQRRVSSVRRQVRFNAGISSLERAILGTTGSLEELEKYKSLARQLGEQAGQPIVEVELVDEEKSRVHNAVVGEIDGGLEIFTTFSHGQPYEIRRPKHGANLYVPANGLIRFSGLGDQRQISDASDYQSHVRLANIVLDEGANTALNPENDFWIMDRRETGLVLVGEEAIRQSGLFEPDLKDMLNLLGTSV